MTSWWRTLLAFLFLSAILIAGTGARPPAQSQITINYPSITGPTWPLYVAREGGYYAKYGLDVNLVFGEHPAGIAMIVSDEADMTNYALELAMQASSRDGSLVAYGSPFKKSLYALMAGKEIRRIRDLKGKRIAVSQVGAAPHTYGIRMLATDGLTSRRCPMGPCGERRKRPCRSPGGPPR